jgi:hypothetical protein
MAWSIELVEVPTTSVMPYVCAMVGTHRVRERRRGAPRAR